MTKLSPEVEAKLDEQQRQRQYAILGRYENQRARTIAWHYVSNYSKAQQILRMLHYSIVNEASSLVDETIDAFVKDIAKNHAKELGIKLEWEESP